MAVAMSQLKKVTLSDNEVTRMIAAKAMNDQAFKDTLCDYIGSQISNGSSQTRGKKFQALVQSITEFRKQIADQAGLQAPKNSFGDQWDLNTYLKQVTHSRVLVAKDSAQEEQGTKVISDKGIHKWGWVVSQQLCFEGLVSSHLSGIPYVYCTLGSRFLAVDSPVPGRPEPIPI